MAPQPPRSGLAEATHASVKTGTKTVELGPKGTFEDLSFYALRRNVTNHPSAELYVCSSIFFMHEHELWAEIPRPQADNIGTAVVMNSGWCAVRCSGLV